MLHLLGTPHVVVGSGTALALPDKAYVLLSLLIAQHAGIGDRGTLAEILWEDHPQNAARANLRNLLARIRAWERRVGIVVHHADTVRVWRSEDCLASDLDAMLAVRTLSEEAELHSLAAIADGELLAGVDGLAPDLTAWVESQRRRFADLFVQLALPVAEAGGARSEALLRKLSDQSPLDERIERALLNNVARRKSPAVVREEYRNFARRLRTEADVEPDLETRSLARMLGVGLDQSAQDIPIQLRKPRAGLPRVIILPPMEDDFAKRSARMAAASMIDDVTFGLCRMRTFAMLAPHTARLISRGQFQPASVPHADFVLFTRLLPGRAEGEYRLGFSLVREETSEVLFGDELRFSLGDLRARHADLSQIVVSMVAGGIERVEMSTAHSGSPTALAYFLIGQERLRSVDLPDVRAARRAFRHVLDLEPGFAPAMSMIARTLSMEWFLLNRGDPELLVEARKFALRAVSLDPLDPRGYRELGNAALYSHDLEGSLEFHSGARDRAPHYADVLLDHADALAHYSRYHQAKRSMDEALALNPLAPDEYYWVAATIQFFLHDYHGAKSLALKMANPEPLGRLIAASAYLLGDRQTANRWRNRMMERHPDFKVADWGSIVPIRNTADKQFFADAMRGAGFP